MKRITVQNTIKAPANRVWGLWIAPEHIVNWNAASDDWHTTRAENDLRVGGKFLSRMEAKDGSFGFDFEGTYEEVVLHKRIAYILEDGRKVEVEFKEQGNKTNIISTFDAETENPIEMQRSGWQAILDNFKKYAESQS